MKKYVSLTLTSRFPGAAPAPGQTVSLPPLYPLRDQPQRNEDRNSPRRSRALRGKSACCCGLSYCEPAPGQPSPIVGVLPIPESRMHRTAGPIRWEWDLTVPERHP